VRALDDLPIDDFECPVCSTGEFAPLLVMDSHGREREASGLFRCKSCGFCFADISQYRRSAPSARRK
jgi:hypothetical protein